MNFASGGNDGFGETEFYEFSAISNKIKIADITKLGMKRKVGK